MDLPDSYSRLSVGLNSLKSVRIISRKPLLNESLRQWLLLAIKRKNPRLRVLGSLPLPCLSKFSLAEKMLFSKVSLDRMKNSQAKMRPVAKYDWPLNFTVERKSKSVALRCRTMADGRCVRPRGLIHTWRKILLATQCIFRTASNGFRIKQSTQVRDLFHC